MSTLGCRRMPACMRACVDAWMRACVCACVRACVRGCVRACVRACCRGYSGYRWRGTPRWYPAASAAGPAPWHGRVWFSTGRAIALRTRLLACGEYSGVPPGAVRAAAEALRATGQLQIVQVGGRRDAVRRRSVRLRHTGRSRLGDASRQCSAQPEYSEYPIRALGHADVPSARWVGEGRVVLVGWGMAWRENELSQH